MSRIFTILVLALGLGVSAHAMEPGTYRAGQTLASFPTPNAETCHKHCNTETLCRAWNFIAINRMSASGVCELNQTSQSLVPSAGSISGFKSVTPKSTQLVTAGTNTIRVGNPHPQSYSAPPQTQMRQYMSRVTPAQAYRKPAALSPAAHTPPQSSIRAIKQAYSLGGPPPNTRRERAVVAAPSSPHHRTTQAQQAAQIYAAAQPPAQTYAAVQRPMVSPSTALIKGQFTHSLDTRSSDSGIARSAALQNPVPLTSQTRPQIMPQKAPSAMAGNEPQHTAQTSPLLAPPSAAQPTLTRPMPSPPKSGPVSTQRAQQSLFGSLYDDVKAPKALTATDIPTDPDAPIATVQSVPVKTIDENPLSQAQRR